MNDLLIVIGFYGVAIGLVVAAWSATIGPYLGMLTRSTLLNDPDAARDKYYDEENVTTGIGCLVAIVFALGLVYAFVRFVKWAWAG